MREAAENVAAQPAAGSIIDTRYWHALDDGRVQCDVCPRSCKLHEGQRGCASSGRVKQARSSAHDYGRSSGFCVDPIEKKPLNHFLPGTSRSCPSAPPAAIWPASSARTGTSASRARWTRLPTARRPSDRAARRERLGCASVAFTYNDPVIFMEYAIDMRRRLPRRAASEASPSPPATCAPSRAPSSTATWTPPTSISRRSPSASTTRSAAASSRRCSRRWST